MFKNWMIIPVVLGIVMTSCEDQEGEDDGISDNSTDQSNTETSCKVDLWQRTEDISGDVESRTYVYNDSDQLARVDYSSNGNIVTKMDTVIYSSNGKIEQINSYRSDGAITGSMALTYDATSGDLISVTGKDSAGTVVDTYELTYVGEQLNAITVTSTDPDAQPVSYKELIWDADGNIVSGSAFFMGALWVKIATQLDDNPNYYSTLLFDPEELVLAASTNNTIGVVTDQDLNLPKTNPDGSFVKDPNTGFPIFEQIPAGTSVIDHTLTISAEGNVTLVEIDTTLAVSTAASIAITYGCD